jgi:hypothetical protein
MRATRDLLRRRLHLVRKRGQLLAHIQNTRAQYNLPAFERRLAYPANRDGVSLQFPDPSVRKSVEVDLALIDQYDTLIADLEQTLVREAKYDDPDSFHRLRSVPRPEMIERTPHAPPRLGPTRTCRSSSCSRPGARQLLDRPDVVARFDKMWVPRLFVVSQKNCLPGRETTSHGTPFP